MPWLVHTDCLCGTGMMPYTSHENCARSINFQSAVWFRASQASGSVSPIGAITTLAWAVPVLDLFAGIMILTRDGHETRWHPGADSFHCRSRVQLIVFVSFATTIPFSVTREYPFSHLNRALAGNRRSFVKFTLPLFGVGSTSH